MKKVTSRIKGNWGGCLHRPLELVFHHWEMRIIRRNTRTVIHIIHPRNLFHHFQITKPTMAVGITENKPIGVNV